MNDETYSPRLFQARSQPQPTDAGAQSQLGRVFGPPLLLEGEDQVAYDELLAAVRAAVNPADALDEMFTADVLSQEWDALRWRRLKLCLVRKRGIESLENLLGEEIEYDVYSDYFAEDLRHVLEENLPKEHVNAAPSLAQRCARNEKSAVDTVNKVHAAAELDLDALLTEARNRKVKDLVQAYVRREPDAVTLVDDALAELSTSIDVLMADALATNLDYVERVDRLASIAESRRNASLREIDRRRPLLAEMLRRKVQQIEHQALELVETAPATGESPT